MNVDIFFWQPIPRTIYQFHYTGWPDHGVPKDPSPVLHILHEVNTRQQSIPMAGPIIVHCRYCRVNNIQLPISLAKPMPVSMPMTTLLNVHVYASVGLSIRIQVDTPKFERRHMVVYLLRVEGVTPQENFEIQMLGDPIFSICQSVFRPIEQYLLVLCFMFNNRSVTQQLNSLNQKIFRIYDYVCSAHLAESEKNVLELVHPELDHICVLGIRLELACN